MNKSDVVGRVAESAGVARQQAESVIDAFFDTVKSAVKSGDKVSWPSFGSFSGSQRAARTGRNPSTGAAMKIPASKGLKFSAGTVLKEFMNSKAGAAGKKAAPAKKAAATKKAPAKKAPAKKSAPTKATKAAKKR